MLKLDIKAESFLKAQPQMGNSSRRPNFVADAMQQFGRLLQRT